MNFSEKDLEDLIFDSLKTNESKRKIINKGLGILYSYDLTFRQVDLGGYGRLDLLFINYKHRGVSLGSYKMIDVMVMEIKKGELNIGAYLQAVRYCKGIEQLFKDSPFKCNFHITLIGNSVCTSDFCYLPDIVDNLHIYTVKLDLDLGITFFHEENYHLTNNTMSPNLANQDVFKRYIKDKIYKYSQLVEEDGLPF